MRALAFLVVIPVVASGACVTSGTYDELLLQHEQAKKALLTAELTTTTEQKKQQELEQRATSLQQALSTEQKKNAELSAQKTTLSQTLAAKEQELQKTSADLAATLKDKAGLKSSVDDMKAALDELGKRKAESDKRVAEYKNLLTRFQSLIDAGKLKVKIVDGRMVVALASDVLFASGSASLEKVGATSVQEVALVLASIPDRKFQVEGHTDNVPIKTTQFPSNWELASARALTVLKTMIEAGMPAERLSAASFGDSKPAVANDTPEQRAQNRRIEIVVVPDLSTLPGFDELQKVK